MKYKQWAPTAFDPRGLNLPEHQEWDVAPVIRTRDSERAERRRFERMLEQLGGEGDNVGVFNFRHWGCGWFDIILVRPDTPQAEKVARKVARMLAAARVGRR